MPEEIVVPIGLEEVLDQLEDYTWNQHNYQTVQDALRTNETINVSAFEKLLSKCVRSLREDVKYTINTLNIISSVLNKVKAGQCDHVPDLVPSAVAVLHILKTTALFNKVEALKILCFEIVLSYPDETLISLAVDHSTELMELFNLYCHQQVPIDIRFQPINIIAKLLKILPPDKKTIFVKEGLSIWFSKIVPTVVLYLNNPNARFEVPMEALELLTEELVHIDYHDVPQWHIVLECIYTPQRYPSIMKSLLEKDCDVWYRLWIVFIKLLKNQITKVNNSAGSPINSMLPVVEMAFKMHSKNRCRAFMCWNVLIDNFSMETNEVYINKRIKLLVIPLMSNNAKVEETALAKLQTWWRLIDRFHTKLDKSMTAILQPFLHFCFGKPLVDKPVLIPGMLTDETKKQCIEAFVELLGHSNCSGCVSWPTLHGKILNTVNLVNNWKDWIHSLTTMTKISSQFGTDSSKAQIKCAWRSYMVTLGELPESRVKRDLYSELLCSMEKLATGCDRKLAEAIRNILLPTFFDDDEKIRSMLRGSDDYSLTQRIMKILLRVTKDHNLIQEAVSNIKPITNYLINELTQKPTLSIEWVLKDLSISCLPIWTAMAESMFEVKYSLCLQTMCKMLLWPLKHIDVLTDAKESTSAWLNLYNFVYSLCKSINQDILNHLIPCKFKSSNHFVVDVSIAMLNQRFSDTKADFDKEAKLLFKVSNLSSWVKSEDCLLNMINVITIIIKKLTTNVNVATAKNTLKIIKQLLSATKLLLEETSMNESIILEHLEDLLLSLEKLLKMDEYLTLKFCILHELIECAPALKKRKSLSQFIKSTYGNLNNVIEDSNKLSLIKTLFKEFEIIEENSSPVNNVTQKLNQSKFTTPGNTGLPKKTKKREASIVDTVVEGGEEYVVVKSNWKFNPRKLTDHQKEKLRRKREDIPALYQDLSQSQDEFKFSTWKADSQDSSSTSKSTSISANEDATAILKNLPNTEIVPNILEHIKPSNENVDKQNEKAALEKISDPKIIGDDLASTAKDPKTRLALKDRIFRNVRNLIEKSAVSNDGKDLNCSAFDNIPKTPINNKTQDFTANSAPPKICTDRPSRVKRKPKKFDDLEVYALKKRRYSSSQNDNSIEPMNIDSNDENILDEKDESYRNVALDDLEKELVGILPSHQTKPDLLESSVTMLKRTDLLNTDRVLDEETVQPQTSIIDLKTPAKLPIVDKPNSQGGLELQSVPEQPSGLKPEIVLEPQTENKLTSKPQTASKQQTNTNVQTMSKQQSELELHIVSKARTKLASQPLSKKQAESKSVTELKSQVELSQPELNPHTKLKQKTELKSKTELKPQAELILHDSPKPQVKLKPKGLPKLQVELKPQVESKSEAEIKSHAKSKPDTEIKPQVEPKNVSESKPIVATKSEAQSKQHLASKEDIDSEPEVVSTPKCESKTQGVVQKLQTESEPKSTLKSQSKPDPQSILNPSITLDSQNLLDLQTVHDSQPLSNSEALLESQHEVELQSSIITQMITNLPTDSQNHADVPILQDSQSLLIGQKCNTEANSALDKNKRTLTNDSKTTLSTPKTTSKNKNLEIDKSTPKSTSKISRIEKTLAIDMVEGHPYLKELSDSQESKRLTRKSIKNSPFTRTTTIEKLNKSKQETKIAKGERKIKDKNKYQITNNKENSKTSNDMAASQDFIESSQDTSITTISMKSTKSLGNKVLLVSLENIGISPENLPNTQDLICDEISSNSEVVLNSKDDTELPRNKTLDVSSNKEVIDLTENIETENIDTQPVTEIHDLSDEKSNGESDEIIFVSDKENPAVEMDTHNIILQPDNQNTADADTQSMDPSMLLNISQTENATQPNADVDFFKPTDSDNDLPNVSFNANPDDVTKTLTNITAIDEGTCSPVKYKEEGIAQRKKEFFNSTLEISPIKTLSPVVEKEKSPEEINDFVVIKLTEPVLNNGEPFENCDSPEVFTEEKVSPDKQNQSPPREDIIKEPNTSPSLSLKKNRPQVRSGGRGAQMLGLCVPNRLQTMLTAEKPPETEENKKNTPISTSARRNLRILYNTTEYNDNSEESEESENFLKLKRSLPSTDCSPSGPILKRKLADIIDEATVSPASKRKRVSFHDPPVSTTICVKKYIEPCGVRSPQNSATKRQERQAKTQLPVKSPKKLESLFKLDTALTKTIESFTDENATSNTIDTDMSSLGLTPVVELVKISDLDDSEPICLDLIDCEDPIENIASELSSPTMKSLLVKEFEGKVDTIGDLAKMTELQINRLCIKAPKVQIAKKVLSEYAEKVKQVQVVIPPIVEAAISEIIVPEVKVTLGVQTDEMMVECVEIQTDITKVIQNQTQTEQVTTVHCSIQTDESGSKSTTDIIKSCLEERPDFIDNLCGLIDDASKQKVAEELPTTTINDLLIKNLTESNSSCILSRVIDEQCKFGSNDKEDRRLLMLKDYLCDRFESRDLVLFCSDILKRIYEKPS